MRQANLREARIIPVADRKRTETEDREAGKKEKHYRAIAFIAGSITTAQDNVDAITMQETAERQAFALRMDEADEATASLWKKFVAMQSPLSTPKTCRDEGAGFDVTYIEPLRNVNAPPMFTKFGKRSADIGRDDGELSSPTEIHRNDQPLSNC